MENEQDILEWVEQELARQDAVLMETQAGFTGLDSNLQFQLNPDDYEKLTQANVVTTMPSKEFSCFKGLRGLPNQRCIF